MKRYKTPRFFSWASARLAAVSLIFGVGFCTLWVRSYHTCDLLRGWRTGSRELLSLRGRIIWQITIPYQVTLKDGMRTVRVPDEEDAPPEVRKELWVETVPLKTISPDYNEGLERQVGRPVGWRTLLSETILMKDDEIEETWQIDYAVSYWLLVLATCIWPALYGYGRWQKKSKSMTGRASNHAPVWSRVRRLALEIFISTSMAAFILICVLWARSYFRSDFAMWVDWGTDTHTCSINSKNGGIYFRRLNAIRGDMGEGMVLDLDDSISDSDAPESNESNLWGFRYKGYGQDHVSRYFAIPYWSLAVALGGLAWLGVYMRGLRKRQVEGHCRVCGYDLRATPERCPECGTMVKG